MKQASESGKGLIGKNGTLYENEEVLCALLEGSPIPTFVIGMDHCILYWNKALEELSGIRADEVTGTGKHWLAFYDGERPCMADLLIDGRIEEIPQWYEGKLNTGIKETN